VLKTTPPTVFRGFFEASDSVILANSHIELHQLNIATDSIHITSYPSIPGVWEGIRMDSLRYIRTGGTLSVSKYQYGKIRHLIDICQADSARFSNCPILHPFRSPLNNILLGTNCGLLRYNQTIDSLEAFQQSGEFEHIETANILNSQKIGNEIWIASTSGLYVMNREEEIVEFYEPLPNLDILHFYKDGETFYLATYGQGLVRWNRKTGETKQYKLDDGLLNLHLMAVYPDTFGNLWLSSEEGLVRFNKKTENIRVYLEKDGITHNEFNRVSHYQAKDGQIFFGGLNGITAFHPKDILNLTDDRPPFVLTDYFELNNETGDFINKTSDFLIDEKIQLSPANKVISIHFALLNYKNTVQNQYAYTIEGWNENWIIQKEDFIKINQLPYGNYTLKIKAKDITGKWNPNEIIIPIEVDVPFYEKKSWQVIIVGWLCSLFFIGYRWQTSRAKKREQILEEMVNKRTTTIQIQNKKLNKLNEDLSSLNKTKNRLFAILAHDLRNPVLSFQSIVSSVNYLAKRNQPERILDLGQHIEKEANTLFHLLDNLLNWALAQRNDLSLSIISFTLKPLIKKVIQENKRLSDTTKIELLLDIPTELQIIADKKVLETILRNLISNAFRYTSEGGYIKISAEEEDMHTVLKITDNGTGINKNEIADLFKIKQRTNDLENGGARFSIGLHLCKELVELMNGRIRVESNFGKGTEFEILLPRKN